MSTSPRKRPASSAIIAGGGVALLVAIVAVVLLSPVTKDALYPPPAVTAQAREVRSLYDVVFAIAVGVFVAVEGLIIWSILRYRRRPEDVDLPPQTHGNNLVEALWTLIPTVIVLYMFALSWNTLNHVDAVSADPSVRINAVAGQFQWQFEYLDAQGNVLVKQTKPIGEGGGMAVPVGEKVYVTLESHDVIHAWYVPRFLFKRDVVPGQQNHFEFTVEPDEAGQVFHGQCAELCGTGHRVMLFDVHAMTRADYDAWLAKLTEEANATPPPAPSGAPILKVAAKDIAYDVHALEATANTPIVIDFKNDDPSSITHDVDVKSADGTVVENEDPIPGGTEKQYQLQPLPAGTYTFFCSVHPGVAAMEGTLTVK
ncbi:MAG TPA: cytochrome c oxidase subunit II [Candidatus Limnocylindrales bacterium]|jgi:cytochrome c oxidase subunit 2|nr:cytochrome c oxidase subunit II [Candidatus Limnocylindrales bacterium]